ncbi:PAS domain-containing protein [Methylobacterium aquaticum]|jgi:PAS domain S-box-containing protein|uniref:Histidine kinase n=1 Tax=Methylobacterium aquaticum TaxID=270351 RepID=A0A0J6UQW4_9HYPH|nr:PAS domain-containing protein [Methylobacterium aquaticum]KMO28466.1 histidine kinase [Methylobacterium aquaticum]
MNVVDLVRLFAESLDVGVLVTDAQLDWPGPRILYANPGFARMSGYEASEVIGLTPRLLQGQGTSREGTRQMQRALRTERRFLGCLQNYRKSGEAYLCEIDVRAIRRLDGEPEAFIAFEREVVRRRGRPTRGGAGRYRPVEATAAEAFLSERLSAFD